MEHKIETSEQPQHRSNDEPCKDVAPDILHLSLPQFSSRARPQTGGKYRAMWRMIRMTHGCAVWSHGQNTYDFPTAL